MQVTRSQVENWHVDHFDTAAAHFDRFANAATDTFDDVYLGAQAPGGTVHTGQHAEALLSHTRRNMSAAHRISETLGMASNAARWGMDDVTEAKEFATQEIASAEANSFTVNEDLTLTDRQPGTTPVQQADRQRLRAQHETGIHTLVANLVRTDATASLSVANTFAGIHMADFKMGGGLDSQQCHDALQQAEKDRESKILWATAFGVIGGFVAGPEGSVLGGIGMSLAAGMWYDYTHKTLPEACK